MLLSRYLQIDRRVLGIFRIYFGAVVLGDVLRRLPYASMLYANDGVLPNHVALFAPLARPYFSLLTAISSTCGVELAMAAIAILCCVYIVGFKTRLCQVLLLIAYASLNARNLIVESGGTIVIALLLSWTAFLPLGDRFSLDAILLSLRARQDRTPESLNDRQGIAPNRTPHTSLAVLAITLQIAAIYGLNALQKDGITWTHGESVHWVLWQNRVATPFAGLLRMHEPPWFSPLFTHLTMLIEATIPLLVLSPWFQRTTRPIALLLAFGLHASIALLMALGPFSYAMIALDLLLLPPWVLDRAARSIRDRLQPRTLSYDLGDASVHRLARVLARLDSFEMLTFGASQLTPQYLLVEREDGSLRHDVAGLMDAIRSLFLGSALARLLDNPRGRLLLSAGWQRLKIGSRPLSIRPQGDERHFVLAPTKLPLEQRWARARTVAREAGVASLLGIACLQVTMENRRIPAWLRTPVPPLLAPFVQYPRLGQGWGLFAPDAPRVDGTIVVDAITADGRHLDPFRGAAPDFEAALHGPWLDGELLCDYFLYLSRSERPLHQKALQDYLRHWQELEGRPAHDRLISFDVFWVSNDSPPPGTTQVANLQRRLVLSDK